MGHAAHTGAAGTFPRRPAIAGGAAGEVIDMFCIGQAANILEISEYEVLRRAHAEQFGAAAGPAAVDAVFGAYLAGRETPYWARRYAWRIIREYEDHRHAGRIGLLLVVAGWLPSVFPEECSLRL